MLRVSILLWGLISSGFHRLFGLLMEDDGSLYIDQTIKNLHYDTMFGGFRVEVFPQIGVWKLPRFEDFFAAQLGSPKHMVAQFDLDSLLQWTLVSMLAPLEYIVFSKAS